MQMASAALALARSDRLAAIAAAAIGAQVGVQITITRSLAAEVPPATLGFLRYAIVLAIFVPLVIRYASHIRIRTSDLAVIGLLGMLNFGLMIGLQNYALHHLQSGRGSLIFSTLPFFTMLISAGCGFERLTSTKLIGVGFVTLGVGLVIGEKTFVEPSSPNGRHGEIVMLACAVIAAAVSVAYRPYVRTYSALPVSAWAVACALCPLAIVSVGEGALEKLGQFSPPVWSGIVALGVSSAFFYWLWLWALGQIAPSRVNVFQALGPVTAALTGAAFLDEPVSATFALGVIVTATGFVLAHRREQQIAILASARSHDGG